MIEQIYISHYKSISDLTVPLRPMNLLIGKNGSGKSNIVDAISFLSDIVKGDLDFAVTTRHGAESVRQWSKFRPFNTVLKVSIRNDQGFGSYKISFSSSRNSYRIIDEELTWEGKTFLIASQLIKAKFSRFENGTHKLTVESLNEDKAAPSMFGDYEQWQKLRQDPQDSSIHRIASQYSDLRNYFGILIQELISFALFTIFPNTIRSPQTVSRVSELDGDGRNIASIIKQMTSSDRRGRDRIVKTLRVVLPQLENIQIRSTAGYYVPVFTVKESSGEVHDLNMSQISDGTLRILGILTALHQPNAPSKIALEEPEQMIHSALLVLIKEAVDEYIARDKNRQVFITTHDAELMGLFKVEDIIAVESRAGATRAGPIAARQRKVIANGLMTLGELLIAEDLEIA